ncbi:serine protease inhibitor [Lentinula edodes]|uniref:Serine protease inhibitor n=1 Tax=Lentinula edodes TaxID=5353 RepID=A0A1Q3ELX7_LENED|nr:serine protease inhibitor [Lentinula edodes]KAH7879022.1 serine protease inhibitor [Lentinula edodes]KAJ3908099.1 serine protease inhibitor [Lentinula edodes]KAJ3921656.1 serine protease inhibitor [Lentinula edodes]GAW08181.1 serine protease inhibitor [Lentinula edodes]
MSLETGRYLIHNGNNIVSRNLAEDRSLKPKRIVLLEPTDKIELTWIIEKSGDGYILNNRGAPTAPIEDNVFALLVHQEGAAKWTIEAVPRHGKNAYFIKGSDGKGWVAPDKVGEQIIYRTLIVGPSEPPAIPLNQIFQIIQLE